MNKTTIKNNLYKVEQFHHANQFIIRSLNGGEIAFQSYDSLIAVVEDKIGEPYRLTLGRDWDYSNTTLRHLYLFLEQWGNYEVRTALYSSNKKKAIQRLIDKGVVAYDEDMR